MSAFNEHKRVKFGHLPGEISIGRLIVLREARGEYEIPVMSGYALDERDGQSIRRHLKHKGRAVQRRRDRFAALEQL